MLTFSNESHRGQQGQARGRQDIFPLYFLAKLLDEARYGIDASERLGVCRM